MQNKLPKLFDKHKVCVICEGNEEVTGVKNYKGRTDQIAAVMEYVTAENYVDMYERVCVV